MEAWLESFYADLHWTLLGLVIIASLYVLGRAADLLVDEAVDLSERSRIPKTVIGATVVSLGTTTPEVAVSVMAAIQGSPDLALGNAAGSVICDTGLILGIAALIAPLRLDRTIVNRQGWIQFGSGFLLVLACVNWANPLASWTTGGNLPQWMGFAFLGGLAAYLYKSIMWSRADGMEGELPHHHEEHDPIWLTMLKLVCAVGVVVLSAQALIPAVTESALRMNIPESIIAATLVAFGTSLPELVTAVTAARKGHGELAVGNIVGADILNVLFVSGAAAAVTSAGLDAGPQFFRVVFPMMLFMLTVFRVGIFISGSHMRRPFGWVLLVAYGIYLIVGYAFPGSEGGM
jgi:cation:H+ antiporter